MKIKLGTLVFSMLLSAQSLNAQFNLYTDYQGIYDDNIFNNYQQISDFINNFSFGSAYNFESDYNNVQLYYEGSLNYFRELKSKSFNSHRIGIVETHLFAEDDNPLNAGINYSFRNNKDEFEVFNVEQISAYANYRQSVGESNFILSGYIFNKNIYPNFNLFSHIEHKLFLTWSSSFQTKTSVALNAEINLKNYLEQYDFEEYLNKASQIKIMLNIGQSIEEGTGIRLYGLVRKNLNDGSRYLLSDSLIYYEEEIFNDIYSYEGIETGVSLKHFFNSSVELDLEAKYLIRNFSSLHAADIFGTELSNLRKDKLAGIGAALIINLSSLVNGLTFSTNWNYFHNASNDAYYKYTNQIISVSINYGI